MTLEVLTATSTEELRQMLEGKLMELGKDIFVGIQEMFHVCCFIAHRQDI